jgi:hypothetical protein
MHPKSAALIQRVAIAATVSAALLWTALNLAGCTPAPHSPPPQDSARQPVPENPPRPVSPPTGSRIQHSRDHVSADVRPPQTDQQTDDERLAQSLASLKQGNLVYNTPQKMKSSQTAHITARIGSDQVSAGDLQSSLPATAGTTTATAATPITTKMKMSLKSADFDITPLSSEEQIVSGAIPTTWEWDVVPKHSGTLRLHLAATVELNNLSRDFAAIDREISVQVDPVAATENFVGKNLVWVLGGCGTGLVALWGWWKKRKTKPAQP